MRFIYSRPRLVSVKLVILALSFVGWAPTIAKAVTLSGQVGPGAFSSDAVVQTFDNLLYALQNPGPVTIGVDTYSTLFVTFRYTSEIGGLIGRSGGGLMTNVEGDYLQIQLGTPAILAGLYTGSVPRPWTADVSFYDASQTLLGTVSTSGQGGDSQFAGWESDTDPIARIRVFDTDESNFETAVIDDFIKQVPEPSTLALLALGSLGLLARRKFGEVKNE